MPDDTIQPIVPESLELLPAHWDALPGWGESSLSAALGAFVRSCEQWDGLDSNAWLNPRASWAGRVEDWRPVCAAALLSGQDDAAIQAFFETWFVPVQIVAVSETGDLITDGMLTGYYEPYLDVREQADETYRQPLRGRPDSLVSVDLGVFEADLAGRRIVGQVENGQLRPYHDRDRIERDSLGEVLAWGRPIDVFFLQIQGSGRLVFEDGRQVRAAFAAHNGLPYRSIGRELVRRGELELHAASKQGIEAWLQEHGPDATAELFAVNPRYVFFGLEALSDPALGPRGSSGVHLTPMTSLAVDPAFHAHGVPIWLQADLPDAAGWSGLMVAQDSGGAITGPLRGDFFWGWGDTAERRAGTTRAQASWSVLLPQSVADRIVDTSPPA